MHIRRIHFLITFCLLSLVSLSSAFGQQKTLVLGGKEGWPKMEKMDGVVTGTGRYGWDCLQLDTNNRGLEKETDLLIDFETSSFADRSGNYSIQKNNLVPSSKSVMGKGAALSKGNGGLRLSPKTGSLFGTTGMTGSFVMEFWINPSVAESGETIFSWRSSKTIANYPLYQMITVSFVNSYTQFEFTNIFAGYTENRGVITLKSSKSIIPNKWSHHSLTYDEESGLLEYRIDGLLQDLRYITSNGRERGGSVLPSELGVKADIEICPNYTGYIDDFRINRTNVNQSALDLRYDTYRKNGGRFVTEPILISTGASMDKLDAVINQPAQTDIMFYVRSGDNYYNWTDTYPEWIPVENHSKITDVSGLYFQLAVDLYPDGGGKSSPSVSEIRISYSPVPDPLPPFVLTAVPGDGQVTLSWQYSVDDTAGGYYLFYGERLGEYLSSDAFEGASPIDVGNVNSITLTGLQNGKIYYFAVASYSRMDKRIMGILSSEVYARPLKRSR